MDKFLNINRQVLILAGMWLPVSHKLSEKIFYYIYDAVIFLYTCVFYPICEWMKYYESLSDMTVFMFYIKMVTTHSWGAVKVIWFHYKRSQIRNILNRMRGDKELDLYGNENFFKYWQESIRTNKIRTLGIVGLACCISVVGSFGIFKALIFNPDLLIQNQDSTAANGTWTTPANKLPYMSWIPFEYHYSRGMYLLAALFQWFPTFHHGLLIGGFDLYYSSILNYISVQFRLVQEAFKSIRRRSVDHLGITVPYLEKDPVELTKQMNIEMRNITKWMEVLIKNCSDLEEMFTYLILGQTFFSLGTLCSCLFMVTTSTALNMEFLMEFIYMSAVFTELFLFSYFGNEVTKDAQDIPIALFYSDWYTSDISFKRNIMINMTRLQKPIYFTIGKIRPINLDTFVSISKTSYSFCTVLKNMETN